MERQERLLLRGQEVAEALNISRALAYRWMKNGTLPVVRVPGGRNVRVPHQALVAWIETNTALAISATKLQSSAKHTAGNGKSPKPRRSR